MGWEQAHRDDSKDTWQLMCEFEVGYITWIYLKPTWNSHELLGIVGTLRQSLSLESKYVVLKPLVTQNRLENCFVWFLGWTWWARRCPGSPVGRRALHSDDPEHLPFRRKRWNERHSRYPSVARDSNGRLSQYQDSHTLPTIPQGRLTKRQRQR